MVSLSFWETNKTAINTKKLPKLEASMIPYDERKNTERNGGKKVAPNITIATPKLAPELSPKT